MSTEFRLKDVHTSQTKRVDNLKSSQDFLHVDGKKATLADNEYVEEDASADETGAQDIDSINTPDQL